MNTSLFRQLASRPRMLVVAATSTVVVCAGVAISWAAVAHEPNHPTAHVAVLATPATTRTPSAIPLPTTIPTPLPTAVPTPAPTATPTVVAKSKPRPTATPVTSRTADHPSKGITWQPGTATAVLHPDSPGTTELFTASFPVCEADPELNLEGKQPTWAGTDIVGTLWRWQSSLYDPSGAEGPSAYYDISVYDPSGQPYAVINNAASLHGVANRITYGNFPYAVEVDGSRADVAAAKTIYVMDGTHVVVISAQGSAAGVAQFLQSVHLDALS